MPQLDYTLLFNQIFWLFIIFIVLYIILTYHFLPIFVKIFKSRKQILRYNHVKSVEVNKNLENLKLFRRRNILDTYKVQQIISSITKDLKKYDKNILNTKMVPSSMIQFFSSKIFYYSIFNK